MRISRFQAVAVAAIAATSLVSTSAFAATKPKTKTVKPVCNLLVDPADDAKDTFLFEGIVPVNEPAADITSADIATDTKNLTTVIRVAKLSTTSSSAPTGLHWKFFFSIGGTPIYTQAIASTGFGTEFAYGTIDATSGTSKQLGAASGVLDLVKNEIRVTVPLADISAVAAIKKGTKIDTLAPTTGRYVGTPALTFSDSTDSATSEKVYAAGTPSCVKVGA